MIASAEETLLDILRTQSIHGLHLGMTDKQIEAELGKPDNIDVPYEIEDEDVWKQRNWIYKDLFLVLKDTLLASISLELRHKDILESEALDLETSNTLRELKYDDVVSCLRKAGFNLMCIDDPFFLSSDNYDEKEILFLPEEHTILQFDVINHYYLASISTKDRAHYGRWKLADC
ncbi:MAG: hypothetical protein DWQ07_22575 [Chloroflexi bacterium]|nr:MAG: hypothetical protein DWQ07_22575 [Chloroflexota bacterium]MBL1193934.1 hypothetical protein [Chloroflexota bacterium]NOH11228.1 hypothetical protein [Chloroflexota bacterium]